MNTTEYKNYHENYMRNNHGSTALHTFFCIFFTVQCTLFCAFKVNQNGFIQFISEYVIIVLPTILAHTIFSPYIYELNIGIFFILLYKILKNYDHNELISVSKLKNSCENKKILSISCLRGLTYLITVICILAVDFADFPRYLAKTERYGYSLMDTGVGLFILMSGLVHKDINKNNYTIVLKSNLKLISILLLLGVTRYLSVKQLDYQEHLTEYGVHWNFFITLAVCKLLSTVILLFVPHSLKLSILIISIHEFLLFMGFENWVFSDSPRTNFVDANREGISSCLGYVSLYIFAASLKKILSDTSVSNCIIFIKLFFTSLSLIFCSIIIHHYRPTSRTLANASYCLYLSATLATIFIVMYFVEILLNNKDKSNFNVPLILLHVNNNGFIYFIVANLTTGLVNMTFRTLFLPSFVILIILNIYKIFTLSFTIYMNKKGIKL